MSQNLRGAALALMAFALFSSHDVIVKVLGGAYSPVQIIFFSVIFSFPLATLMMITDKTPGTLRPRHPGWVALRTSATTVVGISAFYAFSVLPMAQVYSILFATPILITVLAIPLLGERIGLHRGAAVMLGLLGVLIVLRPGSTSLGLGHLAALAAAGGSALGAVIVRRIGRDERPVVLLLYPLLANAVVMGSALGLVYEPMPVGHLGLLAVLSLMGWIAARMIVAAYSTGEAAIVAPMQYSQILWAILYGALFFNEGLDRATALGAGVVIVSGLYIVLRESRGGQSENRPVLRSRWRGDTGTALRPKLVRRRGL